MGRKNLQPVSVDGIEFDALISASESYEASVPEYPVETGFAVSDMIILAPETLEMTLFLSNRPVTWARRFKSSGDRVAEVVKRLKALYFQKKLVTVTTSSETYADMAIMSISFSKINSMMDAMEIPIKFKKVRVTASKTVAIPDSYGKSGTTGASAGTANVSAGSSVSAASTAASGGKESAENKKPGSILYAAASSIGLLK